MRVVDIGCGSGDVVLLASELVGETGQVIGVDREAGTLAFARDRARKLGLPNVSFLEGDFETLSRESGRFDAAVGRSVLMYQRDPVLALTLLASAVRPGGLVVFHEHDTTMVPASVAPLPLHRKAQNWIRETIKQEGAHLHMVSAYMRR
jgi:ubiquinone/menaquinone biosynthesis C-methylase UbiE